MCTLIAAFGVFPRWPLVVAANRDEYLDRASKPPLLWPEGLPFVAPRDEVAGGTWLGVNARGLFVGVTNRFGAVRDASRSSRGKLVVEALGEPSARSLQLRLASLPAERFNPFHLFYADAKHAGISWFDGSKLHQQELAAGVHIVTERSLGGDDRARTELIRAEWQKAAGREATIDSLAHLLRLHAADPIGGTCIHAPQLRYGTRSSTIVFLGSSLGTSQLWFADGHPCTSSYASQDALLRRLSEPISAPRAGP